MITMNVYAKENTAPVIVEAEAVAGLQKLARIFCGDIEKVTGHQTEAASVELSSAPIRKLSIHEIERI